jgi:hypothetical protein
MSPNTTKIVPLAELAPSSIHKIPSVSRLPKTLSMAYGLIFKITITNIINGLLKILIISPPWPFGPIRFPSQISSSPSSASWLAFGT